jgi:hypothetical protein
MSACNRFTELLCFQGHDHGDTAFPDQYAASLTARAVGATNLHANEERLRAFRPITKSQWHDAAKRREATRAGLLQSLRAYTTIDTQMHPAAQTDVAPYLSFFTGSALRQIEASRDETRGDGPEDEIGEF